MFRILVPGGRASHVDFHGPRISVPAHRSDQADEEFADDFYEVLKDRC
ncbi:hypothetical protein J2S54_004940 [Streptomyces sp. DSM 42143]|nr:MULTISPECIES: hypothetical protein [unclassified Streptomyces]MDQ0388120.1 hypothetical protein [Streptomyces sp. DSM 42143]